MDTLNRLKQARRDLDSAASRLGDEIEIWTLFEALDYVTSALGGVIVHLEGLDDRTTA